jgi:2-polyprenyl-6-methoxyphenol hydroxylase-like FAD-dependent oxidoreductase
MDVLVVGAGPTGLLLAGDLAEAGVNCTVLESRTEESNLTRAFGVHARTLEVLNARGIADDVIKTGAPVSKLRLFSRVQIDLERLPTDFPYLLITPQYNVENALEARAVAAGAQIIRGAKVVDVRPDENGVACVTESETYRASYAVGTDGFHSAVRGALGLPFPGKSVLESIMLADVRLTGAPDDTLAVNAVGDCFAFVAPFGDGWYRIFAWDRTNPQPDSVPVDFDELRDVTRRALGSDFGMHDPRWMSRFHSDERQVPQYRVGRVFLAGDAAHVHSPAGGQGMNTGIQDAANLGWKLAAAVRGWAPDGLLDSYQSERHPVGRLVLRSSGAIIRMAMIQSRVEQVARNVLAGFALRIGPVADKAAGTISGIGIRYGAPRGSHPLVGGRAPDVEPLTHGHLVLAVPAGNSTPVPAAWAGRVDRVSVPEGPMRLVRPDGYVAWASDEQHPDVAGALGAWCLPLDA